MKSRITIEVDFENKNLPVIQILSRQSDDVRDGLIKSFLQSLQHTSRWAKFLYKGGYDESDQQQTHRWFISPLTPQELSNELDLMRATVIRTLENNAPKFDEYRRVRLDLNTQAEIAIREAVTEVEKVGASPLLTDAIILLDKARNLVADYIDQEKILKSLSS